MPGTRAGCAWRLGLARRGLGRVWPNPAVGCVLVADGRVVGRGRTGDGGRPHAEVAALAQAGALARGATAYVTLEPCVHTGRTPPCTEALIAAGVARVVVAIEDPDPRVNGAGVEALRAAGIAVEVGCLAGEAVALNRGFLTPGDHRAADADAEARHLARRAHRHRHRREPLDHRPAGAGGGASDARAVGRGAGRRRHGAQRRSQARRARSRDGGREPGAGGGERGAVAAARRAPGRDRRADPALALPRPGGRARPAQGLDRDSAPS